MERNKLSISINGRQYTIVSESSPEYMKKLAEHLNEKVSYIKKNGSNVLGERPLVIAALNVCDEYYSALEAAKLLEENIKKVNAKCEELITENMRWQDMFDKNEFELEMKTMQNKIDEDSRIIEQQRDEIRHLKSNIESLKLKYQKDIENLKS